MSRQLLQWLNPRFTDNLSCVVYRELLSHKILKGHLPCASAIRSVIKIDSTALTRADGVFIASVVAFLQKFPHNSRNPIFAELQLIFRIRVFLTDLWQFPSNGLVAEKPLGEILHVSTPHSTADRWGFARSVQRNEIKQKEDWNLPILQKRSKTR